MTMPNQAPTGATTATDIPASIAVAGSNTTRGQSAGGLYATGAVLPPISLDFKGYREGGFDSHASATTGANAFIVSNSQDALLLADIEARLTDEVHGLIHFLQQFGTRTQRIGEEIPISADFSQAVTLFLALCSLNFGNALALSLVRGIFRDGGREYLSQLELNVKDLFREVNLDGRRFLAVALTDERQSKVFDGSSTSDGQ